MFADTFAHELDDGGSVSVLEQLYADLTLLPAVIEETWRFYPPFPAARRRVIAATELGGQSVEVGTWVVAWLTAANRDPGRFPDQNRYDIRRPRNRHLTFGHGRRSCLGAPLARLETTIALQVLLERLPGLCRDRGESLARSYGIVDPLMRLPCTFAAPWPAVLSG